MESTLLQHLSGIPEIHTSPGSSTLLISSLHAQNPKQTIAIITGAACLTRGGAPAALIHQLTKEFPSSIHLCVAGEPSDLWVDDARQSARSTSVDTVLSIGGGSALDAGKALAVMLEEDGPTLDLLEGVGTRKPTGRMKPWFAIPTTAGTGSEASTNAVLSRPGLHGFKKSLRHPSFRASGVALDAEMLASQPPRLAAMCGMDAFTQLLESWSSVRVSDPLAAHLEDFLEITYHALPQLVQLGAHASNEHRQAMLEGAFLSGVGLSQAGLGTAHGLAGPIGAYTNTAHAHACARLMGPCLRETIAWLRLHPEAEHSAKALVKIDRLNQRLAPTRCDAMEQIFLWGELFGIPALDSCAMAPSLQEKILAAASDRDSPARLGPEVWKRILKEC